MNIHVNHEQRVILQVDALPWLPSPIAGVERRMLDRVGDEIAQASSIVRYAPNSSFTSHTHGGGEEILVLEGTFSDEYGDYPEGTYLRNPPGSTHSPLSRDGCTLFVKLRQFAMNDVQAVRINTRSTEWFPGLVPGLSVMPLHEHEGINTALVRWSPNTVFNPHMHPGGEEIFVLDGIFHDEFGAYPKGSWIRSPRFSQHAPFTKSEGALIYVKVGHLGRFSE